MKKKILCLLLVVAMMLSVSAVLTACGGGGDNGGDNGGDTPAGCAHADDNFDKKCDKCGITVTCSQVGGHVYPSGSAICKRCKEVKSHTCVDNNDDGKCDQCGKAITVADKTYDKPWGATTILYDANLNSNSQELSSSCKTYLAGEESTDNASIDRLRKARNENAIKATGVTPVFTYREDIQANAWSENADDIFNLCSVHDSTSPDVFCNFVYDIVSASLRGAFANLNSASRGTNNFEFAKLGYTWADDEKTGYMYEYMRSLTLSNEKMYCLASDYFVDLVRSFLVVPVNVQLIESIDPSAYPAITPDKDGDKAWTLDDFYELVKEGKWDYDLLAKYCEAIYKRAEGGDSGATVSLDDTLGFAVQQKSGLQASGLVYTSSVVIIDHHFNEKTVGGKTVYELVCEYPDTNQDLVDLCSALDILFSKEGILSVTDSNNGTAIDGATDMLKIRTQFCKNKVLFGGIICVGSLEESVYQALKNNGGFGVVPVPVYKSGDKYLTQVHNVGRIGAINNKSEKYTACTAYLDYVSMHSTDILNQYYEDVLEYGATDGRTGTVEMLEYIRSNVRSAFDKVFEDAIGYYYKDQDSTDTLWHNIIMKSGYRCTDMPTKYGELIGQKGERLNALKANYADLPD